MATLQSGKCFTVPTFFGMCCRSEWHERMYIYKWHEVDQTKHEIFCVHIVCNKIQVKVNLEITTLFLYLRFPYCPNFFWFGLYFTILCIIELCLIRSWISVWDCTYIALLIPAAFNFKMREITEKLLFNIAWIIVTKFTQTIRSNQSFENSVSGSDVPRLLSLTFSSHRRI